MALAIAQKVQPVHREPTRLDDQMTRGDLIFCLEHPRFERRVDGAFAVLQLDRSVRDYLVRSLKRPS